MKAQRLRDIQNDKPPPLPKPDPRDPAPRPSRSSAPTIQEEDRLLLAEAAADTLDRIRHEGLRASRRIQQILTYIETHLFDPKLSVKMLRKECSIRDNSILTLFHRELGRPPYGYIVDCRLEVAQKLLRTTDLQIWKIANLLGYGSLPTFSHAFLNWAHVRPKTYRERTRQLAGLPEADTDASVSQNALRDCLRRARERFFNERRPGGQGVPMVIDGQIFERLAAEEIWTLIEGLPPDEQKILVRERVRFRSTALFELLREKSRSAGRMDRKRGVSIAKLALESLHGSSEAFDDHLPCLEAQAWAWIGNAQRLAMDFSAAEESFARAEAIWELADAESSPLVLAEILQNKAALYWYRRRFTEALALVEKARPIFREHGEPRALAQLLILQSSILLFANRPPEARTVLDQAFAISSSTNDVYLALSAHAALTNIHLVVGDSAAAAESFEEFKQLASNLSNPVPRYSLDWVGGLVSEAKGELKTAETLLERARLAYEQNDDPLPAATVSLDLALLSARQGRFEATIQHASRAQALFSGMRIDRETLMAVALLGEAIQRQRVEAPVLNQLRRNLSSLTQTPQVGG